MKFSLKGETGTVIADCLLPKVEADVKASVVAIVFKDGEGWTVRYTMTPVLKACSWCDASLTHAAARRSVAPPPQRHTAARGTCKVDGRMRGMWSTQPLPVGTDPSR